MIASFIFIATMVVTGIPTAVLFIPWCWMTGNVLPLYKGTRFMLSSSCRLAGVRFQTVGLNNVPKDRACIFMSNHVSNLDPPALISLIPGRTSAFMKRSLMNLPILGTGFRMGEFIAVDRTGKACTSRRLLRAPVRLTGVCCPSRKARSFWLWRRARLAFRFQFMERKRFYVKAACGCIPDLRT